MTQTADSEAHRDRSVADGLQFIMPFARCASDVVAEVGGKALGLGFLTAQGLPVPDGFVITMSAYRMALACSGIEESIAAVLQREHDDRRASELVGALFNDLHMPAEVAHEVGVALAQLGGGPVAVGSSAVAEDTANASLAGQQDTYLWIDGTDAVQDAVKRCWAILYTPQAIGYRRRFDVAAADVAMAVVVQTVTSPAAGSDRLLLRRGCGV